MSNGTASTITTPVPIQEVGKAAEALSAESYNLIANFINAMKKAEGRNGIKIYFSDVKIVFDFTGDSAGGSSDWWRGDYDPDIEGFYMKGDGVQIDPEDGIVFGIIPGTYVCNKDGATPDNPPIHPLSDGYTGEWWRLLSTWPQKVNDCDAEGNPVVTYSDSQPEPTEDS